MSAGILFCHGLLNTIGTRLAALLNGFSSVWHMVGTLVIVVVLLAVAPTHQSASFVFGKFYGVSEVTSGITNNGYVPISCCCCCCCCAWLSSVA